MDVLKLLSTVLAWRRASLINDQEDRGRRLF
jgi:hypothetical protein